MYEKLTEKILNKNIRICIVGLGYVGLPTAIFFAEQGFDVIGVERNEYKISKINQGISTIGELNLDYRLIKVVNDKKLFAKAT